MADYYQYWGKTGKEDNSYHLLPYHCLDVAAVADAWWKKSHVIRNRFYCETEANVDEYQIYAWVMFFIALHDLGKFDVRFQLKAKDIAHSLFPSSVDADESYSKNYYHGSYSSYWLINDLDDYFHWLGDDWDHSEKWEAWQPWIDAVAGHHGVIPEGIDGNAPQADINVIQHDKDARIAFIHAMESLFLKPAKLSLNDNPPVCDQDFLAGFCSICDWLGSSELSAQGEKYFSYVEQQQSLHHYFISRKNIAGKVLKDSGLFHPVHTMGGMLNLFPHYTPQLVQTLVDDLAVTSGLTIIEAPTGSGKTEAALAYASRLLAAGVVESIIFALPTQATANAMLERLTEVTEKLFSNSNLLLAHGKARFNEIFIDLKKTAALLSHQDAKHETEAVTQCSQWLGQSRKRVFLGQVGVCTIDQVLISVLPVKHKFIRSFGLGKSILIVDEVHAYDSYMYGLLEGVLKKQKHMHGSAILLSATLPKKQKKSLMAAWGGELADKDILEPYPLISHVLQKTPYYFVLSDTEQQALQDMERQVQITVSEHVTMQFDDALLDKVIEAAKSKANVVLICNLVADAQETAQRLSHRGVTVDLFHSRFRFMDRKDKESNVLNDYGRDSQRKQGRVLVATQVVEQSLDLDFDWMLTQLCPIDLLFQRLGRLHRHKRTRPLGFESPQCTVIVPYNHDYILHKLIYGNKEAPNSRVLWRSEQLLRQQSLLHFPKVYRPMIEAVYQEDPWQNEPESIQQEYNTFQNEEAAIKMTAWHLIHSNPNFEDSDSNAALLTRDGEMSLNIIPCIETARVKYLLDGTKVKNIEEHQLTEVLSLHAIPAPASWARKGLPPEKEGMIWLPMQKVSNTWVYTNEKIKLTYSVEDGLKIEENQK